MYYQHVTHFKPDFTIKRANIGHNMKLRLTI
jgi:hypothetical protein